MRAVVIESPGTASKVVDLPRPTPGDGEVLVRIGASGVNPLDTKIRAGAAAHARHPFPVTLGMDLAGTIEQVGAQVTEFSPGDEVYGMTGGGGGIQGTLADSRMERRRGLGANRRASTAANSASVPWMPPTPPVMP